MVGFRTNVDCPQCENDMAISEGRHADWQWIKCRNCGYYYQNGKNIEKVEIEGNGYLECKMVNNGNVEMIETTILKDESLEDVLEDINYFENENKVEYAYYTKKENGKWTARNIKSKNN